MDFDFGPFVDAFTSGDYPGLIALVVLAILVFALRALSAKFPALAKVAGVLKRVRLDKPAPQLPQDPVPAEPEPAKDGLSGVKVDEK